MKLCMDFSNGYIDAWINKDYFGYFVYLRIMDDWVVEYSEISLSPEETRKLAKSLLKLADECEELNKVKEK